LAIFFDARFKHLASSDKDAFFEQAQSWIIEELAQNNQDITIESATPPVRHQPSSSSNSLFGIHATLIGEAHEEKPTENLSIIRELIEYKSEGCISLNVDPLAYWKVRTSFYSLIILNFLEV